MAPEQTQTPSLELAIERRSQRPLAPNRKTHAWLAMADHLESRIAQMIDLGEDALSPRSRLSSEVGRRTRTKSSITEPSSASGRHTAARPRIRTDLTEYLDDSEIQDLENMVSDFFMRSSRWMTETEEDLMLAVDASAARSQMASSRLSGKEDTTRITCAANGESPPEVNYNGQKHRLPADLSSQAEVARLQLELDQGLEAWNKDIESLKTSQAREVQHLHDRARLGDELRRLQGEMASLRKELQNREEQLVEQRRVVLDLRRLIDVQQHSESSCIPATPSTPCVTASPPAYAMQCAASGSLRTGCSPKPRPMAAGTQALSSAASIAANEVRGSSAISLRCGATPTSVKEVRCASSMRECIRAASPGARCSSPPCLGRQQLVHLGGSLRSEFAANGSSVGHTAASPSSPSTCASACALQQARPTASMRQRSTSPAQAVGSTPPPTFTYNDTQYRAIQDVCSARQRFLSPTTSNEVSLPQPQRSVQALVVQTPERRDLDGMPSTAMAQLKSALRRPFASCAD